MKLKRRLLAAGLLAAVVSTAASAAFASSTISVGGASSPAADVPVTGSLSGTISFLTDYDIPATCTTASAGGYVKRGAALAAGTKIGAITTAAFNGCLMTGLNYPVAIGKSVKVGSPAEWSIHLTATPVKGSASAPIEIRNVEAQMHSTNVGTWACELDAKGTIPGTITQGPSPQIKITPTVGVFPLALQAYDGTGAKTPTASTCLGWIYTGDKAQMTATFNLSTPVTW